MGDMDLDEHADILLDVECGLEDWITRIQDGGSIDVMSLRNWLQAFHGDVQEVRHFLLELADAKDTEA